MTQDRIQQIVDLAWDLYARHVSRQTASADQAFEDSWRKALVFVEKADAKAKELIGDDEPPIEVTISDLRSPSIEPIPLTPGESIDVSVS